MIIVVQLSRSFSFREQQKPIITWAVAISKAKHTMIMCADSGESNKNNKLFVAFGVGYGPSALGGDGDDGGGEGEVASPQAHAAPNT